jgi:hypothetical protein
MVDVRLEPSARSLFEDALERAAPLAPGFVVWAGLLLQFAPLVAVVIILRR